MERLNNQQIAIALALSLAALDHLRVDNGPETTFTTISNLQADLQIALTDTQAPDTLIENIITSATNSIVKALPPKQKAEFNQLLLKIFNS